MLGGNCYGFVIVDDYYRFTWTLFLATKDDIFDAFAIFVNHRFKDFCDEFGISHNFSWPRTPKQNDVVERKNRVLEELAMTMLNEMNLPKYF